MESPSYVYVFTTTTGHAKVGVSVHPEARAKWLVTGCPYDVSIADRFKMSRRAAFAVEKSAHAKLSKYRVSGEWFECSADIASGAVVDAIDDFVLGSRINPDDEFGCLLSGGDIPETGALDYGALKSLQRGKHDDGNGLQVRVGPSTIEFRLILGKGEKNEVYLGQYPRMSLAEARKLARKKAESLKIAG